MQRSISAFGLSLPVAEADEPVVVRESPRHVRPDPPAPRSAPGEDVRCVWDAEGRPTSLLPPGSSDWLHFEHGERGALRILAASGHVYLETAANVAVLDNGVVETYGFDAAGRPTRVTAGVPGDEPALDLEIAYDAEGRIARLGAESIAYEEDRLVDAALAPAGSSFDFDDRGNRCARHAPGEPSTLYRYGDHDRLVEVERAGRTLVRYGYDAAGRRVCREDEAGTTLLHYDGAGNLLAETDQHGRARATYLCVGTRCLARIDGPIGAPAAAWYHLDHAGSAWAVTDAHGSVTGRRRGHLDVSAPGPYMRRHRDRATGFYDFGSRDFDPQTRSFTTPDTYTFDATDPRLRADQRRDPWGGEGPQRTVLSHWDETPLLGDRYAFCLGDPINNIDLDGHSAWWFFLTIPSSLTWALPNTVLGLIIVVLNLIMEIVGWLAWPFVAAARHKWDLTSYPWGLSAQTGGNPENPFDLDDRDHFWLGLDASARQGVPWALFNGSFVSVGRAFTLGNVVLVNDIVDSGNDKDTFQRYVVPNDPDVQLTLHRALREHEMQHTAQYAYMGPLFHCLPLPLIARLIENKLQGDHDLLDRSEWWKHIDLGGGLRATVGSLVWLLTAGKVKPADFEKWINPATWWQTILPQRWAEIATQAISFDNWLPGVGIYELDMLFRGGQAKSWFERNAGASSGHTYGTVVEVENDDLFVGQFTRVIGVGGPFGPFGPGAPTSSHSVTWTIAPNAPLPPGSPGTGTGAGTPPIAANELNPADPVNDIDLDKHNNVATEKVVNGQGLYFHATTPGTYAVTGTVSGESESQQIKVKDIGVNVNTSVFVCQSQAISIKGDDGATYSLNLKTNNSGGAVAGLSYTAGKTGGTDTIEIRAHYNPAGAPFSTYGDKGLTAVDWVVKSIDIVVKEPTISPLVADVFVGATVDFTFDLDPQGGASTSLVPGSRYDAAKKQFVAGRGAIAAPQDETVTFQYACRTYTAKVTVKPIAVTATPPSLKAGGAAQVAASGGTPPYSFEIVAAGTSGPSIDPASGAYKAGTTGAAVADVITVTDAKGGRGTVSIAVAP
ncbi:MAG: hypothetical protein QOH12_2716 [Solirubrobacteraceae bacterium]|jgi:YD repeat-containing protein|nr:hypothetical protein [Solirubrobacteraceae bacterium]